MTEAAADGARVVQIAPDPHFARLPVGTSAIAADPTLANRGLAIHGLETVFSLPKHRWKTGCAS
ncbi:hypothetical protein [Jannaschia sp. CCS1]|uniref:hypothetical protein n=1 Tax=Jannaschia sp. (strain CCS1) TaxID=290400 RepID=UPI00030B95DD|nr:hypothetical protein [Jannaschia sp. CCS1]